MDQEIEIVREYKADGMLYRLPVLLGEAAMLTRDEIVQKAGRDQQSYLAAEYVSGKIGIFGSYARGGGDRTKRRRPGRGICQAHRLKFLDLADTWKRCSARKLISLRLRYSNSGRERVQRRYRVALSTFDVPFNCKKAHGRAPLQRQQHTNPLYCPNIARPAPD